MKVCAVIPAAGHGSRLGLDRPKLLAPIIGGATLWTILRDKLQGLADHIHVVLSPAGLAAFDSAANDGREGASVSVGVQPEPVGMGDAVFCGFPVWSQADTLLVIWGDQIHVSRDTLRAGLLLHDHAERRLVLPLAPLPAPYVEYRFDSRRRLSAILQEREGDRCRPGGWGDVGTFILSTGGLGDAWSRFLETSGVGARTGEINFLPFLLFLAQTDWEVKCLPVADPLEARGINTPEDLEFFQDLYHSRACR